MALTTSDETPYKRDSCYNAIAITMQKDMDKKLRKLI